MSKQISYHGSSIITSAAPREADETDTTDDGDTAAATVQSLAGGSGCDNAPSSPVSSHGATSGQFVEDVSTNDASDAASDPLPVSNEAEARRRSFRTAPGAFHVIPLAAVEAAVDRQDSLAEASDDEGDDEGDDEEDEGELAEGGNTYNDPAAVVDAQVEAVAVPVDEAVATYQAVPVVDALTARRILEDGEEQSYRLESGTSQQSASLEDGHMSHTTGMSSLTGVRMDGQSTIAQHHHHSESTSAGSSGGTIKFGGSIKNKYVIWGLAALLLVAVVLGVGLGLGLSRPEDTGSPSSESQTNGDGGLQGGTADTGSPGETDRDTSYRLVEMEISPQIESSVEHVSSSVSLGLLLPTYVPGTLSRNLIAGWDRNGGIVKVYRSQMKKGNESVSFGPFIESATISLSDGSEGNVSDSSGGTGSAFTVDIGADGEVFAVSYRSRIKIYASYLHQAKDKQLRIEEEGFAAGSSFDPAAEADAAKTLVASDPESFLGSAAVAAANSSDALPASGLWNQRGPTLVGDDDPAIRGFGSSIGYSPSGPHFLSRIVVGSDSGHVRIYRSKWLNGTILEWQRLDGGLLDPDPDSNPGKAVVAMAGSGVRFAVGYPSLGKVSLYRFIDEENIDETSSRPNIEFIDEIYSKNGGDDMFGQSLSVDIFANFLVVGAKGYVRTYWLRVLPSSLAGFEYVPAGDKIFGEEDDGEEFGSVVASGRVPQHNGGCVACPFVLDKQRIAISSPAYNSGRGRVLLYQYNEDERSWLPLVSPVEGEVAGEGMAHAVKISPDMGLIATSSNFGEVRTFRLLPLQRQ